jgi:hypothetical protein
MRGLLKLLQGPSVNVRGGLVFLGHLVYSSFSIIRRCRRTSSKALGKAARGIAAGGAQRCVAACRPMWQRGQTLDFRGPANPSAAGGIARGRVARLTIEAFALVDRGPCRLQGEHEFD